jgi:hypothetical protein
MVFLLVESMIPFALVVAVMPAAHHHEVTAKHQDQKQPDPHALAYAE